jgi:hypothetical protein
MILELTNPKGKKCFIKAEAVAVVEEASQECGDAAEAKAVVVLISGTQRAVRETPEQVVQMLGEPVVRASR